MADNYKTTRKSDETIRLTVLTNVCRMMINRGKINNKNIPIDKENKKNPIKEPYQNDKINNDQFYDYIKKKNDDDVYRIPLDTGFVNASGDEKAVWDGKTLVVKIIANKINELSNNTTFNDFYNANQNNHKIVIVDEISDKSKISVKAQKYYNTEIFLKDDIMIDLMGYISAPIRCEILEAAEIEHIINMKIGEIKENDQICEYYNGKAGQIMRIISPSSGNAQEVRYRKISEPRIQSK